MSDLSRGRLPRRTALLLAAAAAVAPFAGAAGQGGNLLRGSVDAAEVTGALLPSPQPEADATARRVLPAYQPASEAAVPERPAGSVATENDAAPALADPFADAPAVSTSRPPTTARERAEQEALRRETPPRREVASERAPSQTSLDQESTGTTRQRTVDSLLAEELELGVAAERAATVETRELRREDDPYAPLGLRLGSFTVRSSIEQGLTATTNATSSAGGRSAVLSESALRLSAISDWSEHQATADAYGIFRKSVSGEEVEETEAGAAATLRLDLADDLRAVASLGYERRPESASSPAIVADTVSRPFRERLDGSLGLEKDVGKLRFAAVGAVEHDSYDDAELVGGGTVSQSGRDSTLATLRLRVGYEVSPALMPFVEAEAGRRLYDEEVDAAGFRRSADRLGTRAGVQLDLSEKLAGELAAGYLRESFDDDRLESIDAVTIDGRLAWSPERGTVLGLLASTEVEGTTDAGESGSVLYSTRATLDRQIRANLSGTALIGAAWRDYAGSNDHDLTLSAEAGLTWWLNRYAGLSSRIRHERVESSDPGRETETSSIFVGLKVQR